MTNMIERVACAIYTENAAAATGRLPWSKAHEATKASMRKLARAALEEVRVPTEEMRMAVSANWGHRTWSQYSDVINAAFKE